MDLLKQSLSDEKYCILAVKGLAGLLRVLGGFKNHTQYIKVYSMMVVCV